MKGDVSFTISQNTYIHADSIIFSDNSAFQKTEIVLKGKVYTSTPPDSARFHKETQVAGEKSALASAEKKRAEERLKTLKQASDVEGASLANNVPAVQSKIYQHFPLQTATFTPSSKNLAVPAGGSTRLKYSAQAELIFNQHDLTLLQNIGNRIFGECQFNLNICHLKSFKVRPPPVG